MSQAQTDGRQQRRRKMMKSPRRLRSRGMPGMKTAEYVDEITEVDIDDTTKELMNNLMSDDFILANLREAEFHELKHLAWCVMEIIEASRPPQNSSLQGEYRKDVLEDEMDGRRCLRGHEKADLYEGLMVYMARLSRGRGGWQQDKLGEQISVSRHEEPEPDDGGGLLGLGGLFK